MAATGREVVHGLAQLIAAEEPLERADRTLPVDALIGGGEGVGERFDQCRGIEGLFITVQRCGEWSLAAAVPAVTDEPDRWTVECALSAVPIQSLEPGGQHRNVAQSITGGDESLGEPCIVVGQIVLEPSPLVGAELR